MAKSPPPPLALSISGSPHTIWSARVIRVYPRPHIFTENAGKPAGPLVASELRQGFLNSIDFQEAIRCQNESQQLSLPLLSFPWQSHLRRWRSAHEETVIVRLIHARIVHTRIAALRVNAITRSPAIVADMLSQAIVAQRARVITGSLTIATIAAIAVAVPLRTRS
jgi:hypothetical protein